MIGDLWQKGTAGFPSAPSIVQAAGTALGLGGRLNAISVSALGIAMAAVAFAGVVYLRHADHAVDAQLAASRIESANIDLQDQLASLRDKVAASSRDLSAAQAQVTALTEEMRAKLQQDARQVTATDQIGTKGDKVTQLSTALHQAEAQRATLAARLSKAEADLADQQARQNELLGQIDQWQKRLEQLSSDRDKLKARVTDLEKQSALRHATQAVAAAQPAPAPATPTETQTPPARVAGVLNVPAPQAAAAAQPAAAVAPTTQVGHGTIDQFARVLASAGVDVRQLFAQFGVNQAAGGPFIPVRGPAPNPTLSSDKLAALKAMIRTLPVAAPLTDFDVSSPFGVRGDPENGHTGFHTGIDLTAPYDSPVYSTAPGTVTFAGWRDDYGKIVEIDHGNGIATRYAHLHAFTVSVGQRVGVHQQVGYLGSTGRATGPHVHYEVVVNGEPQDPEKFFNLSRYVPAMTVPVAAHN
ncbi:MAG TPA: peptidoglycan DD-metalloendopeptidase family protein [Stellaceae bacterium]|nr:peptidoglycan DD-metalloendopeptidase family protein [Stellaceae bacterium]